MRIAPFTDQEYRLLLSALERERKVREQEDKSNGPVALTPLINSISRKVHNMQYSRQEESVVEMEDRE